MKRRNARTATIERNAELETEIESQEWTTRDLTTRTIGTRIESVNESERTVDAVISTQNPAVVFDWRTWSTIDEILISRGARFGNSVPLLDRHNSYNLDAIFGSVREIRAGDDEVTGRIHVANLDELPDDDDIRGKLDRSWAKIRQGHLRAVSVGYNPEEYEDIPAGESRVIDGRNYKAGSRTLRVTKQWSIREVSLVPIGADEHALIRASVARRYARKGSYEMNAELRGLLESFGLPEGATDVEALRFLSNLDGTRRAQAEALRSGTNDNTETDPSNENTQRADTETETEEPEETPSDDEETPAGDPDAIRAATQQAIRDERNREREIRALDPTGHYCELIDRAVDGGWSVQRARAAMFERITDRGEPVRGFNIGRGQPTGGRDLAGAIAAGIAMRANLDPVEDIIAINPRATRADRERLERDAENGYRFRDMMLIEVCRYAVEMTGQTVPETRLELAQRAISGGALTGIFNQSVSARMIRSYLEAGDSWSAWTTQTDVPDYKLNDRTALSAMPSLNPLGPGGIADHATVNDRTESYRATLFARQWIMTEQDLVNDSMDAVTRIPVQMGRAAARLVPDLVYAHLLTNANLSDGTPLFDASRGNLLTGAGSALAPDGIKAARAAMLKLVEKIEDESVNLNIAPAVLVCGPDDIHDALQILTSTTVAEDGGAGTRNVFASYGVTPYSENRITANGVRDPITKQQIAGSDTQWFMFADPSEVDTIEVGFLSGTNRRPQIRSSVQNGGGKFGVEWDISHRAGVKALGALGMQRSDGA